MMTIIGIVVGCLVFIFLGIVPILAAIDGANAQKQYERACLEYQQNKRGEIR